MWRYNHECDGKAANRGECDAGLDQQADADDAQLLLWEREPALESTGALNASMTSLTTAPGVRLSTVRFTSDGACAPRLKKSIRAPQLPPAATRGRAGRERLSYSRTSVLHRHERVAFRCWRW